MDPILTTTDTVRAKLTASREELLDLGMRNPLLNFRPSIVRGVPIVEERAATVYDLLVRQGKAMTFLAAPEVRKNQSTLPLPELSEDAREALRTDTKLQTPEPTGKLEARLLNTYYTARLSLEEQGVNTLYLALGMLRWYETPTSEEPRLAPLVLVPVVLERSTAGERFKLRYSAAEVEGNLSLQAKLKASFGLSVPLPELEEGDLAAYWTQVTRIVANQPRWQVEPDTIALSFFSFGKFMIYRDLDPDVWPVDKSLLTHPTIGVLLNSQASFRDKPPSVGEEMFLDQVAHSHELHQVVDADSSQLLALLAVNEGRNLVIQGPPGTGKSQTIANLLAEAIGAGKRVLFVAEKMAALEVVKRRLDMIGLGAACLELHSHKANKKALHEELKRTLELGRPTSAHIDSQVAQLATYRHNLNAYAAAINAPIGRSQLTTQRLLGKMLQLATERADVPLPRLTLARMPEWTDADMRRAEDLSERLRAQLRVIGVPQQLLFWGCELTVLLPAEQDALAKALAHAGQMLAQLEACSGALARHLHLTIPDGLMQAEDLLRVAQHAQLSPVLHGSAIADPAWREQAPAILTLLQAGAALTQLHTQYDAVLLPEAWGPQLPEERAAILQYGGKWWNFLISGYRRARTRLQGLFRAALPKDPAQQLAAIDAIHEAAQLQKVLESSATLASQLFGSAWQQSASNWPLLEQISSYLESTYSAIAQGRLPAALLNYLTTQARPEDVRPLALALETALENHRAGLDDVIRRLQLQETRRFGGDGRLQSQSFGAQHELLAAWSTQLPDVHRLKDWNNLVAQVRPEGLDELVDLAESWTPAATLLTTVLRQCWYEFLLTQAFQQQPTLRQFERVGHEEVAARFRETDKLKLYHNRVRATLSHWEALPRHGDHGQLAVLRNEFARKIRHLPIRQLIQQAGQAVQAIKPVFMMSPLSIANFLPPGAVEFDLVVFDEASQVKPVDALGAIARGKQLVVVGDSKQLPPSSFFDSVTREGTETDEENVTADIQSVLELCKARQMPERMLRWHYRSLHQSLIAASNHLFYEDRLVIFPSPGGKGRMGLLYHHLPATHYERGTTRTNPLEAAAVADAVMHHARTTPKLTLGVVAFSTVQRQAIQDALELRRRQSPETEEFFNRHFHEPFFIKNLENVQGDERDVILISIGYGRTAEGYLSMSFGPLNGDGGERRLNVLITRAKQRCEVFTNLTGDDLDLTRTKARGVAALKMFLYYAQHGRLDVPVETGREPDSPFEESVLRELTNRGYTVRPQVGSQGFYIDLAVVDPRQPGRYVLGIECDGAMYHSARSARDRDRLRQQVLEAVGWRLHRIWSTDWFHNPARELQRLVDAIEEARKLAELDEPEETDAPLLTPTDIHREDVSAGVLVPAYMVAQVPQQIQQVDFHLHPVGRLASWLTEVVRVESPIHVEEATRRLVYAAGLKQVGSRLRATVEGAVKLAVQLSSIHKQGDFLWEPTMKTSPVRDRSAAPDSVRKLSMVAPEELAQAALLVSRYSFSIERTALAQPTAKLLGFVRLNDEMHQQVDMAISTLVVAGLLTETKGILKPATTGA